MRAFCMSQLGGSSHRDNNALLMPRKATQTFQHHLCCSPAPYHLEADLLGLVLFLSPNIIQAFSIFLPLNFA